MDNYNALYEQLSSDEKNIIDNLPTKELKEDLLMKFISSKETEKKLISAENELQVTKQELEEVTNLSSEFKKMVAELSSTVETLKNDINSIDASLLEDIVEKKVASIVDEKLIGINNRLDKFELSISDNIEKIISDSMESYIHKITDHILHSIDKNNNDKVKAVSDSNERLSELCNSLADQIKKLIDNQHQLENQIDSLQNNYTIEERISVIENRVEKNINANVHIFHKNENNRWIGYDNGKVLTTDLRTNSQGKLRRPVMLNAIEEGRPVIINNYQGEYIGDNKVHNIGAAVAVYPIYSVNKDPNERKLLAVAVIDKESDILLSELDKELSISDDSVSRHQNILSLEGLETRVASIEALSSAYDGLTGIINAKTDKGKDVIGHFVSEAAKNNEQIVTICLDGTYFKDYNTNYGHDGGDVVLKHYANTLQEKYGKNAVVCRDGGDEFLVLMKSSAKDNIDVLAEAYKQTLDVIDDIQAKPLMLTRIDGNGIDTIHAEMKVGIALACPPQEINAAVSDIDKYDVVINSSKANADKVCNGGVQIYYDKSSEAAMKDFEILKNKIDYKEKGFEQVKNWQTLPNIQAITEPMLAPADKNIADLEVPVIIDNRMYDVKLEFKAVDADKMQFRINGDDTIYSRADELDGLISSVNGRLITDNISMHNMCDIEQKNDVTPYYTSLITIMSEKGEVLNSVQMDWNMNNPITDRSFQPRLKNECLKAVEQYEKEISLSKNLTQSQDKTSQYNSVELQSTTKLNDYVRDTNNRDINSLSSSYIRQMDNNESQSVPPIKPHSFDRD